MKTTADISTFMDGLKAAGSRALELRIVVHSPGSLGGSPSVGVDLLAAGFDWDMGKVLIYPDKQLTTLTDEEVKDITKSVRLGESWHSYQEFKRHKAEVKALKDEIAILKAALEAKGG